MKKSKENAEHYKWGNNCDGWHLLKSDSLGVIQECMPVGTTETLHYHERSQQLFFILRGEAIIEIENETFLLRKDDSIHVAKGLRHLIKNASDSELHFLVISEPKSHGDRINC